MSFSLEKIHLKAIFKTLSQAIEHADPYLRGHSDRVASLSIALGMELGLSTRQLEILKDAGALHDIGKIGVNRDILHKKGALTPEEYEEVKRHTIYGYNILKPLGIQDILDITLLHHERCDGKGYPTGAHKLPILVRVLQVCDVWDALTSDRSYRGAMSAGDARALMSKEDNPFGFDEEILGVFMNLTGYLFMDGAQHELPTLPIVGEDDSQSELPDAAAVISSALEARERESREAAGLVVPARPLLSLVTASTVEEFEEIKARGSKQGGYRETAKV